MRLALVAALAIPALFADTRDPSPAEIEEIIKKFASNETAFQRARDNYTYRQSAKVVELDESGRQGGVFEVVSDIVYPEGKRTERVVRAPVSTLSKIQLTPEDEQDLRSVQPFVLNSGEIEKYFVRYLGRETIDEIGCYAFAVKPKKMEQGQRYFQGVIWVDDRDLMIVKTYGRGTGLKKKGLDYQYPKFETYREQIDGKYWFPTYTIANSVLPFENGPQRIRMTVRYEDYKQFKADVKITFGDVVESKETQPKKADPAKPKP
jgi:hypothetical protein